MRPFKKLFHFINNLHNNLAEGNHKIIKGNNPDIVSAVWFQDQTATATLPHPPRKRGPLESSGISQRRGLKTSPSLRKLIKHVHPHLSSLIPPSCRLLYLFRRCEDVAQRRSKVPLLVQTNLMVPAGFLPVSDLRCFQSRCHLAVLRWRACC